MSDNVLPFQRPLKQLAASEMLQIAIQKTLATLTLSERLVISARMMKK